MSSVGLSDIPRTTSFRLALLFLGLFGTASLGVFGFLYWQTAGYLASGVDDWLDKFVAVVPRRFAFFAPDWGYPDDLLATTATHDVRYAMLYNGDPIEHDDSFLAKVQLG